MAEIWGAVAIGAAGLIGGAMSANAAGDAADAQAAGGQAAINEQRRQFDLTRQDMQPWLEQGGWALGQQRNFLNGDWSGFEDSPDYAWAVDQGFKGLNRGAAANGAFGSGGADADRIAFGQGLATQYAGNYWNRLAGLSGAGQQTAANLGSLGANAATNIGNAYQGIGAARASGYTNQANAWNGALNNLVGAFGYGQGQNWGRG